jgi:hypothetical protein
LAARARSLPHQVKQEACQSRTLEEEAANFKLSRDAIEQQIDERLQWPSRK